MCAAWRGDSAAHLRLAKGREGLAGIDGIEALSIDPADAAPANWRRIHSRPSAAGRRDPARAADTRLAASAEGRSMIGHPATLITIMVAVAVVW
jgi:hypothetical protein